MAENVTEQIGKITLDLTHYPGEDLYCDGKVEDELLSIVKDYAQVEYRQIIEEKKSWPILYHLSPLRENIVDWIPMKHTEKVLEVGSGCGAITGALSRKAGEVTCVDLSKKRSMINAYRHAECENVTIHVGNFKDIEPDLPDNFDYIFLIGVFEYGQSYMGSKTPFEDFLNMIKKHLAPGGRIVIAIENKYGLKYFAGCKEDHLGTYFSGIENYEAGGGVRTFSRKGLEKILASCGVEKYHFYYPYPDYKFMTTLYSDEYLPGKGELSNNMRNFDRDRMLLFDEKNAFDGIVEDKLFSVFSNSYVVIIGDGFDVKYSRFSNDRAKEYCIRTDICRDSEGKAHVEKHPLCKEAEEHIRGMEDAYRSLLARYEGGNISVNTCTLREEEGKVWDSFEFLPGRLLSELLDECLEKDDLEGFHKLFCEYVERTGYNPTYPAADFDMIFSNIMVDGDKWSIIDYEWTFGKEVDPRELAFRAVYCYLLENEKRNKLNLDLIMEKLEITEEEAENFREQERGFQEFVTGQHKSMAQMRDLIGNRVLEPGKMIDRMQDMAGISRVQVYEDDGKGFFEENSYFVKDAYVGEQDVEVTLSVDGNVQILRIDPAMTSCVVTVEELLFNGVPVPTQDKKIFYTNGKVARPAATCIFATTDPNLYIKVADLDRKAENELFARLKVVPVPERMAADMAASVKKIF